MITASDVSGWNCTKLQDFFNTKTPKWIAENLTLDGLHVLQRKVQMCARDQKTMYDFLQRLSFLKHAIHSKQSK